MPKATATTNSLAIAQDLDAMGFNVLPAKPRQKSPYVEWKKWSAARTTHMMKSWFGASDSNFWIATGGISTCYVLDIDSDEAEAWWRQVPGAAELMDTTVSVQTRKGRHYYFHVPGSDQSRGWSYHHDGIEFDIRGTGQGVIVPPSVHESGFVYEWVNRPDPAKPLLGMQPCPDWLKSQAALEAHLGQGVDPDAPKKTASKLELQSNTSSMLSSLLNRPAKSGGRNDWMAKVAGHYAKTYPPDRLRREYDNQKFHLICEESSRSGRW